MIVIVKQLFTETEVLEIKSFYVQFPKIIERLCNTNFDSMRQYVSFCFKEVIV